MSNKNQIHHHTKMSEAHNGLAQNAAIVGHEAGVAHHLEKAKNHAAKADDLEWMDWERENNILPRDAEPHGSF